MTADRAARERGSDRSALERALVAIRQLRARLSAVEAAGSEPIAIVGAGCRFPPDIEDAAGFWALLAGGVDAVRPPPRSRPELAGGALPDPDAPERAFSREGAYLSSVDQFDAAFFGIAPREAAALDPQQRMLLETSYEALEDAGIRLDRIAGTAAGVFIGAGVEDYAQLGLRSAAPSATSAYAFTGSDLSLAAGRIAYSFGLQGPALVVDTACSSSLVALHLAVQSLRRGESSLALVGGVNLILSWEIGVSLCQARALAPDGRCKTFDASADGYGRGEGCCVLVLKRWSDAVRDRDRCLALVLGSAVNQDGASSGLTAPNGVAQQALLGAALRDARARPEEIAYVEAHGTGTPLGDPIEVGALAAALGPGRAGADPLLIGSVKTQIGHLEAAAGIAGVLKVALALQHELLPASLHQHRLNPQLDLDAIPAAVVASPTPWRRNGARRLAGISSFGISGTNAHAVLAEPPAACGPPALEPGALSATSTGNLLLLSARSERALREQVDRTRAWLRTVGLDADEGPAERRLELDAICREAALRRTHHAWRLAAPARTTGELAAALDAWARGEPAPSIATGDARGAAPGLGAVFVVSGQGGQWPRMGRGLLARSPAARRAVEAFDRILREAAGWSVLDVLRDPSSTWLTATDRAQPALCALQIALVEHWRSWGVTPVAVVGHSAGEVAAAHAAGVLSLEHAVLVALHRGRLMQKTVGQGTMATIELPAAEVEAILLAGDLDVQVAAINAPGATIVSGTTAGVLALVNTLEQRGVRARRIAVDFPAHSARMDPILEELEAVLAEVQPRPATVPLWSTVRGDRARATDGDARYWSQNARSVVQFGPAIARLLAGGAQLFLEIGPHPVLGLAVAQCAEAAGRTVCLVPSMRRDADEVEVLLASLGALHARGVELDLPRLFGAGPRLRADLPRHPWHRQRHWQAPPLDGPRIAPSPAPAGPEVPAGPPVPPGLEHRVEWQAAPPPCPPPDSAVTPDASGRWIVLADRAGLGRRLARAIEERGGTTVLIPMDERSSDPGELARQLSAALPPAGAASCARLVHLWNLDLEAVEAQDGGASPAGWRAVWRAAAGVVDALSRLGDRATPRTWIATRGAQAVAGRGGDRLLQAMAWAVWGSVAFEQEELGACRLDLDPRVDHDQDAAALIGEMLRHTGHPGRGSGERADAVAFRAGARAVPRLVATSVAREPRAIRDDSTYLITGGLGALGLGLAGALVSAGARHLALVGRRGAGAGERQRERLAELERRGARLVVFAADVAERAGAARVIDELAASAPPVRGVVHAAGVLEDGLVLGQDEARFARVVAPKVAGAWHLHTLTAGWPLDFFVLFSSVAGTLCPPGQASYAAANAGLDALARRRRAADQPAVSIAWGPWAAGGMIGALSAAHRDRLAERGLASLDEATGHALALSLLCAREPCVVAMPIPDPTRLARGFSFADGRPCALLAAGAEAEAASGATGSFVELLRETPAADRAERLADEVERCVRQVLGLGGALRRDAPFRQLGMDSLMAVTVRNRLAAALERPLPAALLFDHPTVEALARELARRIEVDLDASAAHVDPDPGRDPDPGGRAPGGGRGTELDLALLSGLSDSGLGPELLSQLTGLLAGEDR